MPKNKLTLDNIFDLAWDWRHSSLLMQAHGAGVFDAAYGGWKEADGIALALSADKRATSLLLLGLTGIGLMEKSKTRFRNSQVAEKHLAKSSPDYRGHILTLATRQAANWQKIPEVMKSGKPIAKPEMTCDQADAWHETFIMAMDSIARQYADRLMDALPVADGMKLMDIGAGSGRHMIELLKKYPGARATAFDRPASEKTIYRIAKEENVSSRITFVGGNLTLDSFGTKIFDGILISNVLRIMEPKKACDLFIRAATALKPGGFLAINEIPLGADDQIGKGAIFAVQLMLGTTDGHLHTALDISGYLLAAGLLTESTHTISERMEITIGRKPG